MGLLETNVEIVVSNHGASNGENRESLTLTNPEFYRCAGFRSSFGRCGPSICPITMKVKIAPFLATMRRMLKTGSLYLALLLSFAVVVIVVANMTSNPKYVAPRPCVSLPPFSRPQNLVGSGSISEGARLEVLGSCSASLADPGSIYMGP